MIADYEKTLGPSQLARSEGGQTLGTILHSSDKLGKLLQ